MRTGDKRQPFPEEINRRIAGMIADRHFAPTDWARENLLKEGVSSEQVVETGNTVIDALQWVVSLPPTPEIVELLERLGIDETSERDLHPLPPSPPPFISPAPRLILVTAHRRENFGEPLENICDALKTIAVRYRDDVQIVYPVHLNPNVQEPVYRLLGNISNITLLPPLDYLPLVHLMKRSYLAITDSGGIQEEAPGLGKPVLVLRAKTERPEGVEAGTVKLVGTDKAKIVNEATRLLDDDNAYAKLVLTEGAEGMAQAVNSYGDGKTAERIAKFLPQVSVAEVIAGLTTMRNECTKSVEFASTVK